MEEQTRAMAIDLAIKLKADRPVEEMLSDAVKILAWLRPAADVSLIRKTER